MALETPLGCIPHPFRGRITERTLSKVKNVMQELLDQFVEDLQTGEYSARDENKRGSTLLHAYAKLLVVIGHFQTELHDLIEKTVSLLVHHGACVNATVRRLETFYVPSSQRFDTALSLPLDHIQPYDVIQLGPKTPVPRILSEHEMDAFSGQVFYDLHYVGLFAKVPDLALEYGCSQLSVAAVRRDQFEVERLIRNYHNADDAVSPPYSPLCLAVGWNAGASILLKAGADPSTALHCSIVYEDETTLQSLLNSGPRLNAQTPYSQTARFWAMNKFACSALILALWRQRLQKSTRPSILSLVVQALASSRQKLMELANQYISTSEMKRCGWNGPSHTLLVSDAVATALAKLLLEKGVRVPPSLWPNTKQSIYHEEWMTATVASNLFSAGFREIDLVDNIGQTPLLVNAHFDWENCFERNACLYWFLRNGAERVVFPHMNGNSLAHVLAANLGEAWYPEPPIGDHFSKERNTDLCRQAKACLPAVLDRVFSLLPPSQWDNCQCFCSQSGCLPVHALLKLTKLKSWSSRWPKSPWPTWKDEQMLLNLWSQCSAANPWKHLERSEICRLQIFNRLAMRHTCCAFGAEYDLRNDGSGYRYLNATIKTLNYSEKVQFQQEDAYAKSQLDAFMELYHELDTKYQDQSTIFWDTWWVVLEEYIPSVNWGYYHTRHVQIHGELLPIEQHELCLKIDQIREQVTRSIASSLKFRKLRRSWTFTIVIVYLICMHRSLNRRNTL